MEPLDHASNADLIAKLAGKTAAEALAQQFPALTDLAQASFDELQTIKGIGQSKAAAIKSAFLLAQRLARESYGDSPLLDTPDRVADLLREQNRAYCREFSSRVPQYPPEDDWSPEHLPRHTRHASSSPSRGFR